MNDYHALSKTLGAISNAPSFDLIASQVRCRHWLSYICLKEAHLTGILCWLLNPNEGHGLRDYFCKRLLESAWAESEGALGSNVHSSLTLSSLSLGGAIALQEVPIQDGQRRIDLLLLDYTQRTIVLIERKDGSRVGRKQLSAYLDWAKKNFEGYSIYPIVLDSHTLNHGSELTSGWVQLDDSWLVKAIEDLLNREYLPTRLEHLFQDLLYYVFGEWDEDSDAFYSGASDALELFAHQNSEQLKILQRVEIQVENQSRRLVDLSEYALVTKVIANPSVEDEVKECAYFCLKHADLLKELRQFTVMDKVASEAMSAFPMLYAEVYSDQSEVGVQLILKRDVPPDNSESDEWPYWMTIRTAPDQVENDSAPVTRNLINQPSFMVEVGASRYCIEKLEILAEAAVQVFNLSVRRKDWKRASPKLIAGGLDDLTIKPGSPLYALLDEFQGKVQALIR